MSKDNDPGFDFGRFEAEFADVARAHDLRDDALKLGERLWKEHGPSNDALTTRRRFIIAGDSNKTVPVPHERMLIVPRPRDEVVAGVQKLRISRPFLPSPEGAERRLDPRFIFLDLFFKRHVVHRVLLSNVEYSRYRTSDDILVTSDGEDVNYTVPADVSSEIHIGATALSRIAGESQAELPDILSGSTEALQNVNVILEKYEPSLQDNLPLIAK